MIAKCKLYLIGLKIFKVNLCWGTPLLLFVAPFVDLGVGRWGQKMLWDRHIIRTQWAKQCQFYDSNSRICRIWLCNCTTKSMTYFQSQPLYCTKHFKQYLRLFARAYFHYFASYFTWLNWKSCGLSLITVPLYIFLLGARANTQIRPSAPSPHMRTELRHFLAIIQFPS